MNKEFETYKIKKQYEEGKKDGYNDGRQITRDILEGEAKKIYTCPETGTEHHFSGDGHIEYKEQENPYGDLFNINVTGEKGNKPSIVDKLSEGLRTEPILDRDKD